MAFGNLRWRDGAFRHRSSHFRAKRRTRIDECPQRQIAALASLAGCREPMSRALHEFQRAGDAARRLKAADMVRARREPSLRFVRWRTCARLDVCPQAQGRRGHGRSLRCVPDLRSQCGSRGRSPQCHAGNPDAAGGDRDMAARSLGPKPAALQRPLPDGALPVVGIGRAGWSPA